MHVLIIGGTGVISRAVTTLAASQGFTVTVLNRGNDQALPEGVEQLVADVTDATAMDATLAGRTFDVVANFLVYTPEDAKREIERFQGRCGQYLFVSSASAYLKPAPGWLITESTPLGNPYWAYSQAKADAEQVFMTAFHRTGFPVTIVRPTHTYGPGKLPTAIHGPKGWVPVAKRILRRQPVLVPGDGSSLWTVTWTEDFAVGFTGLFGHVGALGEAYHITAHEALTWDMIYRTIGFVLGEEPIMLHVASDAIVAHDSSQRGPLLGDKAVSAVFDTTKITRAVPAFSPRVPFREGARRVLDAARVNPSLWDVEDPAFDALCAHFMRDDRRS